MTYPRWIHHPDGRSVIVHNEVQEAAYPGFGDIVSSDAVAKPEGVSMALGMPIVEPKRKSGRPKKDA